MVTTCVPSFPGAPSPGCSSVEQPRCPEPVIWGTEVLSLLLTCLFVWHPLNLWVAEAGEGSGGPRILHTSILEARRWGGTRLALVSPSGSHGEPQTLLF